MVPPIHPEWPKIKGKNIPFHKFLAEIASSPQRLAVLYNETVIEFDVTSDKDVKNSPHFPDKNMRYYGWSGMLQMEWMYPDEMDECKGWLSCIDSKWGIYLNEANTTMKTIEVALTALNTILKSVFDTPVGAAKAPAIKGFVSDKILKKLYATELFKALDQTTRANYGRQGNLHVPDAVRVASAIGTIDRLRSNMRAPREIPEIQVVNGVKELVRVVYGNDLDTSKPVVFDKNISFSDKVKAALCLLELVCGSRMKGVMFVNWFSPFSVMTMKEWIDNENDKSDVEGVYNPYGSWERCVVMTRPSKEGTKTKRAYKQGTGVGKDELPDEAVEDRIIVKPLNIMFLDPGFLDNTKFPGKVHAVPPVTIFIDLLKSIRSHISSHASAYGLAFTTKHGVLGVVDKHAETMPPKAVNWYRNAVVATGNYAKMVFPFIGKNEGTHFLRKIYTVWAFNAYAKNTMKEAGFAREVLGHRSFEVSLNYTSVILVPAVDGDVTNIPYIRAKFKQLSNRILELENTMKVEPDDSVVWAEPLVPKLTHMRNLSTDEHVERAITKIEDLNKNNVWWTNATMRDYGISTLRNVRAVLTRDHRFKQLKMDRKTMTK
jgi:hypothetical protein|tara:strand:+ start:1942 stop:3747 length:1806 start_codon:yes stop_codon:yes gene_type:complete